MALGEEVGESVVVKDREPVVAAAVAVIVDVTVCSLLIFLFLV
jgi:hypothetical protein